MRTRFGDGRDWFLQKRFGLFVHWGLYAIPAWHEQLQWRRHVARNEYDKLIEQFNPDRFDPDRWLDLMEEVGMEYLCFTTKHHDGFCLWDTSYTDFKVTNSPYGKDVLALLANACHKRGVPLCLYYSVVDWHNPSYPNQGRSHELDGPQLGDRPDIDEYLEFVNAQVEELCTNYGDIRGFWWDMNVTGHSDKSINEKIRSILPNAIINNRGFDNGDFGTPERDFEKYKLSIDLPTQFESLIEACQSVGRESWGYRADEDYYTDRHLMASIIKILSKGGNYLLNVGPKPDGTIPKESSSILRRIGPWYKAIQESLQGTILDPKMTDNQDVLITRKDDTIYVHMTKLPTTSRVLLRPLTILPERATLLNTREDLHVSLEPLPTELMHEPEGLLREDRRAFLRISGIPANDLSDQVMVLKLEFNTLEARHS